MKATLLLAFLFLCVCCVSSQDVDVFSSGENKYMCIRIPILINLPGSEMLAFAEARAFHTLNYNCCVSPVQDYPSCVDKDIVVKRSKDNGRTWGPLQILYQTNTNYFYSNPAPVYNDETNVTVLVYTRCLISKFYDECDTWVTRSRDYGVTWTASTQISASAGPSNGLSGPPGGLLLESKAYAGKMLFAFHTHDSSKAGYTISTQNDGLTFSQASLIPNGKGGESQIAEFPSGTLLQTIRQTGTNSSRGFSFSDDGGITWNPVIVPPFLPNTDCQGSLIYSKWTNSLLFSTIASSVNGERLNLTIYQSKNLGATWNLYGQVWNGPSAYSSLIEMSLGRHAIFYERGFLIPWEHLSITFFGGL